MLEVFAHAQETYPEECCGFLVGGPAAGAPWPVDEARRCVNRQNDLHRIDPAGFPRDARTAYNLGPKDLRFLDDSLREGAARATRVIYHSHNDVGAYFSAEDKRAARPEGELIYPAVVYMVVDAQMSGVWGARLFAWDDGRRDFIEVGAYDSYGKPGRPT